MHLSYDLRYGFHGPRWSGGVPPAALGLLCSRRSPVQAKSRTPGAAIFPGFGTRCCRYGVATWFGGVRHGDPRPRVTRSNATYTNVVDSKMAFIERSQGYLWLGQSVSFPSAHVRPGVVGYRTKVRLQGEGGLLIYPYSPRSSARRSLALHISPPLMISKNLIKCKGYKISWVSRISVKL